VFDPFGDYATAGYLRNELGLKDSTRIKEQEHLFFVANVQEAADYLARCDVISYADFCEVHRILFSDFYPWAGRDRLTLGVAPSVHKGARVRFEESDMARRAVEYGLELGNDSAEMTKRPGEIMGLFAWGHPFLDGNGRTMVVVHTELMARAGLMVDWTRSPKDAYLEALTMELREPRKRPLDSYLQPLMCPLRKDQDWVEQVLAIVGLDSTDGEVGTDSLYAPGDPAAAQEYEEFKRARQYEIPDSAA
jgi:cell filamentation protein